MDKLQPIKIAVAGFGHIGKKHVDTIMSDVNFELTAIVDINLVDAPLDKIPTYNSIESLCEDQKDLEAITLCTPNQLHASMAIEALEFGKHVVIEKPMTLTKASCEEVIHKALNFGKNIFCVMQNRYSPVVNWLKSIMTARELGDILMVHIDCFWNRDERYYLPKGEKHPWHGSKDLDGGVLFTQFSHYVDLVYWLFGDIKNINANLQNLTHSSMTNFPDSGSVIFDFVEGGMGSLNFSTSVWGSNFESTLTIIGKKGTIKIGGQYMDTLSYCYAEGIEAPQFSKERGNNHKFVYENVWKVLREKEEIATNAMEGLKTVDIIERIYKSGK